MMTPKSRSPARNCNRRKRMRKTAAAAEARREAQNPPLLPRGCLPMRERREKAEGGGGRNWKAGASIGPAAPAVVAFVSVTKIMITS
ncbi:hypothetical protein Taro_038140 [Colocasia esculenta]|uniref:Uncharacterized protein n=1 Tax=Colocasia esculenta TaxID=4460 RepID=A0A843W5W8_COLES|nr:hypothetical protein [Colocasia esculenta]